MRLNPLMAIDFYKADHRRQYPAGTEYVYSNLTPRSARYAPVLPDFDGKVTVIGVQSFVQEFLIEMWNENFFARKREEVIAEYQRRMNKSLGVGAIPIDHIGELHDLGYLPLRIKALAEGTRVDLRVPLLTIVNTNPKFFWLTNYIETLMSAELWKTMTTATIANEFYRLMVRYAERTGADKSFVPIQGHDFSARGMSGFHDAARAGVGHLTRFIGTDTVAALEYVDQYYGGAEVDGVSVPATEHSVMCLGTKETEIETFRRLITDLYPEGIVSIVSDTWDFWRVLTEYAPSLKTEILNRRENSLGLARVVFRPDSGDPVKVVCGDPDAPVGSPEHKGAVECLWDVFGGTTTSKGYRVLNPRVGLIYGDSITLARATAILDGLTAKNFASTNVVFGIGSYTYQGITRDSFGFAMKATWGVVNGEPRAIFKDPKTDDGQKKSAKGLIRVERESGRYVLHDEQTPAEEEKGELKTIFEDGKRTSFTSLGEIRQRLIDEDHEMERQEAA